MIGKLLQSRSVFQRLALWQMPLMLFLSLEIGWPRLFWRPGRYPRYNVGGLQLPVLSAFIYGATLVVPVKTADFFILLLITLLPFTWRLDQAKESLRRRCSPCRIMPDDFSCGVCLYLSSAPSSCWGWWRGCCILIMVHFTALTGFRLETLTIRWLPIITGSFVIAAVIVGLFSVSSSY